MLSTYIKDLKEKTGLNYKTLAEQVDIKYTSLISMRDGDIKNVSLPVLKKFSAFENREELLVLYDILYKDREDELLKDHSKNTLYYLCKLYMDNYSVDERYVSTFPLFNEKICFEGYFFRKKMAPNYTVVDSWELLEKEFGLEKDSFSTNEKYIYNIYLNAVGKFFNCTNDDIRRYVILIEDEETYNVVSQFKVKGAATHVVPVLIKDALAE